MKIKYDSSQPFQLQAISAITGVFEGQPDGADAFDAVLQSRSVRGAQGRAVRRNWCNWQ